MVKKGDIFYTAWLSVDERIGEKSTVEYEEWHVTSIDKRGIFIRCKNGLTWGKVSKKHFDYGWLKLTAWTAKNYCKKFETEEALKAQFYKSKAAAYRSLLQEARKLKRDATRILNQIKKTIAKHTKKRKQ